jgi:endonuclease/exonuclease/phosphatase (EEP) superfamily protein YafD
MYTIGRAVFTFLSVLWGMFFLVLILIWTPLRFLLWGNVPVLETLVSLFRDVIWIPVSLALPFYLLAMIWSVTDKWMIRILSAIALLGYLTFGTLHLSTYFRFLFIGLCAFAVLFFVICFRKRQVRLNVLLFAILLLILAINYNNQLLPKLLWPFTRSQTLTIMSYNILVDQDPEKRDEVIALIKRNNPDLLFLQETNARDRQLFQKEFAAKYPHQLWSERNETYNGGAIFSIFPFTHTDNIDIHTPHMRTHTNVNHTQIDISSLGTVHLLNCHLFPSGHTFVPLLLGEKSFATFVRESRITYERRNEEARQIANRIESLQGEIILAGDFNDTPGSRIYRRFDRLLQNGFEQAGWGLGTTFGAWTFRPHLDSKWQAFITDFLRIDHVFCSQGFKVVGARVLSSDASDHKPQLVKLRYDK